MPSANGRWLIRLELYDDEKDEYEAYGIDNWVHSPEEITNAVLIGY
ncbi:hypothetical protein C5167_008894 [Papaver somniferum]|uniref:Uncharacterized protein n=1 Tax=Papaver somniferum TaxID=3469 RepID=A0A4Y7JVT4_PAPSO|nr:hypothetical protein C5167_008894 [Papaver somniferum]